MDRFPYDEVKVNNFKILVDEYIKDGKNINNYERSNRDTFYIHYVGRFIKLIENKELVDESINMMIGHISGIVNGDNNDIESYRRAMKLIYHLSSVRYTI